MLLDSGSIENGALKSAPLDNAPLDNAPLDSAPLDSAPLDSAPLDSAPLDSAPLDSDVISDQSNLLAPSDTEQRSINGWDVTIVPFELYESVKLVSITKGEENNSAILYRISGIVDADTLRKAFDDMNYFTRYGPKGEASNIPVIIDLTELEDFDVFSGQFDARIELKRIGKGKGVVASPPDPMAKLGLRTLISDIKTAGKSMRVSVVGSVWEAIEKIIYIPEE